MRIPSPPHWHRVPPQPVSGHLTRFRGSRERACCNRSQPATGPARPAPRSAALVALPRPRPAQGAAPRPPAIAALPQLRGCRLGKTGERRPGSHATLDIGDVTLWPDRWQRSQMRASITPMTIPAELIGETTVEFPCPPLGAAELSAADAERMAG